MGHLSFVVAWNRMIILNECMRTPGRIFQHQNSAHNLAFFTSPIITFSIITHYKGRSTLVQKVPKNTVRWRLQYQKSKNWDLEIFHKKKSRQNEMSCKIKMSRQFHKFFVIFFWASKIRILER